MLTHEKQTRSFRLDDDLEGGAPSWPILSLVRMLWKRRVSVLLTWGVLSAAVLTVVMLLPATYRAETLILVDQQKIPEKFVNSTVSAELQDRLATISQQILSNTRLQKIIDTFKLYEFERKHRVQEEILEMMRDDIKVAAEKGYVQNRPGAFRVSYEGKNPNTVAEVTNQLGNLFIEENLRARETIAQGTSDFMKSQMDEAKKNLEIQEKKLSQFKLAYNGELPQQEASLAQELSRLQMQLQGSQDALNRGGQNKVTVESALNIAQSSEATLKRMIEAAANGTARGIRRGTNGSAGERRKSERMEDELLLLRAKYGPRHPDIVAMTAAIETQKAKEQEDEKATATKVAAAEADGAEKEQAAKEDAKSAVMESPEAIRMLEGERGRIATMKTQLDLINSELKLRQADQDKIVKQIESVQARLRRLPVREQEMTEVTRDYETSKANYNSLQDKIFAADMSTEMERRQKSERFTVLDPARVPEIPISPNRPLFAGLGCIGSLVLSIGVFMFAEIRKNKFLGEWELPEGTVVLGRVPSLAVPGASVDREFSKWMRVGVPASIALLAVLSVAAYMRWIRG